MFDRFGMGQLVTDLQALWARTRAGRLAAAVTPPETGYAKLLTKAIDCRLDGQISIKELAEFRVKLDRALLSQKRNAPKPMRKSRPPRHVMVRKDKPKPATLSERDLQLVRLMTAHQRANSG